MRGGNIGQLKGGQHLRAWPAFIQDKWSMITPQYFISWKCILNVYRGASMRKNTYVLAQHPPTTSEISWQYFEKSILNVPRCPSAAFLSPDPFLSLSSHTSPSSRISAADLNSWPNTWIYYCDRLERMNIMTLSLCCYLHVLHTALQLNINVP